MIAACARLLSPTKCYRLSQKLIPLKRDNLRLQRWSFRLPGIRQIVATEREIFTNFHKTLSRQIRQSLF